LTVTTTDLDLLPPAALELVHRIEAGQLLGATRNVVAIGELLADLAHEHISPAELGSVIRYFQDTRGAESQAVANGLDLLTEGWQQLDADPVGLAVRLRARADWFAQASGRWSEAITSSAGAVFEDGARIVAFDYSSIVATLLAVRGPEVGWRVTIPESRALEGGRPYLEELPSALVDMVVPDVALGRAIRDADVVVIGAESCYADGSCHNTVGSLTAALCAESVGTPFYVATPLLKYCAATPVPESSGQRDFADLFGPVAGVDTVLPENERVPAELITGYLTERGQLRPSDLAAESGAGFADVRNALEAV
jgi:ribose 1,5-bisphosphate isomerase